VKKKLELSSLGKGLACAQDRSLRWAHRLWPFYRCFYKLQPLRKLTNIRVDIVILENENKGLLEKIIGGIGLT
jgi:hypothetical protein